MSLRNTHKFFTFGFILLIVLLNDSEIDRDTLKSKDMSYNFGIAFWFRFGFGEFPFWSFTS